MPQYFIRWERRIKDGSTYGQWPSLMSFWSSAEAVAYCRDLDRRKGTRVIHWPVLAAEGGGWPEGKATRIRRGIWVAPPTPENVRAFEEALERDRVAGVFNE